MSEILQNIECVRGLTDQPVEALRYAASNIDPHESTHAILSMIKTGSRVLDIGCGTGSITEIIVNDRRAEVIGLEPNNARATAAQRRGLKVIHGTYDRAFAAAHGPFDCVVLADVLEHLEDPCSLLTEARDALSTDGHVVASIPNVAHWTVRWNLLAGRFDYAATGIMDATHLRWFTKQSILRLFEAAGYEVLDVRHSAGAWMAEHKRFPFSLVPEKIRGKLLWSLGRHLPGLLACQYIVSAQKVRVEETIG